MRFMWVQQWAVLPVIVEDRGMAEENVEGGRLPPGSHTLEASARNRLGERERERPTPARRFLTILVFFFLFSFFSSLPRSSPIPSDLLIF